MVSGNYGAKWIVGGTGIGPEAAAGIPAEIDGTNVIIVCKDDRV